MTITQTAAPTGTAVTITGTVRTPLTLVRRIPDRRARVGFRVDTDEGPYNVHASGALAELLRLTTNRGDRVIVHAPAQRSATPNRPSPISKPTASNSTSTDPRRG